MPEHPDSVVLLGAGGLVHIMYWHLQTAWPGVKVAIVDEYIEKDTVAFDGKVYPIIKDWNLDAARLEAFGNEKQGFRHFLLSLTEPKYKKSLAEKALARGLEPAPTIIHPTAVLDGPEIEIGAGGLIMAHAVIHSPTRLGEYVTISTKAVMGHHCDIGKYASLNAGSIALGFVTLGEGAQLGAGTVVRGFLKVAPWVTTGIQSAVVKNLEVKGGTYVGVPAKLLSDSAHTDDAMP